MLFSCSCICIASLVLAPEMVLVAMQSGFSLGHGYPAAGQRCVAAGHRGRVCAGVRLGFDAALDWGALSEVAGYFDWLCEREGKPRGEVAATIRALRASDPRRHGLNLRYQLK